MRKFILTLPGLLPLVLALSAQPLHAQYPPQAPLPGHVGIPKDSPDITAWAANCTVERGWINIADTSLGKVSSGTPESALGAPSIEALSLGDGGSATLSFEAAIINGPGPDFAVFENAFANPMNPAEAYLELAFVEVSSDGEHFVRFPAVSGTQDTQQNDNFTYMDAALLHNLAGKYALGYGTPFDLEELKDEPGLDVNNIRHIRIVDVVGSLDSTYASFDQNGRIINDPYPSPYPTGGFDISAVGVLHTAATHIAGLNEKTFQVYPNPAVSYFQLNTGESSLAVSYQVLDLQGKIVHSGQFAGTARLECANWPAGVYVIRLFAGAASETTKLIKH